jgi:hypothetical protein
MEGGCDVIITTVIRVTSRVAGLSFICEVLHWVPVDALAMYHCSDLEVAQGDSAAALASLKTFCSIQAFVT